MFKRAKVVMLPTNEKAILFLIGDWNKLYNTNKIRSLDSNDFEKDESYQHLYITSNDEITLSSDNNGVFIKNEYLRFTQLKQSIIRNPQFISNYKYFKIIASTDTSLNLPQPSQSFIEKYITEYSKGNNIEDVMFEYEKDKVQHAICKLEINSNYGNKFISKTKEELEKLYELGNTLKIKVNSKDNTITIKKIKDSFTLEEMKKAFELGTNNVSDTWKTFDEFINNL